MDRIYISPKIISPMINKKSLVTRNNIEYYKKKLTSQYP